MGFAFRVQAIPLGYDAVSFRVDDTEITRYNAGLSVWRPYLFPLIGPSGRMLTRFGHPRDPVGHRHHYSVWLAHADVNGLDFWTDDEHNKQVHLRLVELQDGAQGAGLTAEIAWDAGGKRVLLERRAMAVTYPEASATPGVGAEDGYWYLDITSTLTPAGAPVVLGVTSFGLLGVRMAKSISVTYGGGRIQNEKGGASEREILGQPANWGDYSGWVSDGVWEGITVFDAPMNPGYPALWHVREDGWMCPSQFRQRPLSLETGQTVTFRHRLVVHGSGFDASKIEEHYRQWLKVLSSVRNGC